MADTDTEQSPAAELDFSEDLEAGLDAQEAAEPDGAPDAEAEAGNQEPPQHWAQPHQEQFRKLTPEMRSFVLDRSREMEAAHTRRSQEVAPLRNFIERWKPTVSSYGGDPVAEADRAMQAMYGLRTGTNEQRIGILHELARSFGVQFQPAAPDPNEDPFGVQAQIKAALGPIIGALQQQQAQHQNFVQTTDAQNRQQAVESLTQFRNAVGADGKPLHPFYDEVQDEMITLARARQASGQPMDIAAVYEQACWVNPSVRVKLQASERARNSLGQGAAGQDIQRRARAASAGLTGTGRQTTEAVPDDLGEALAAEYDRLAGVR